MRIVCLAFLAILLAACAGPRKPAFTQQYSGEARPDETLTRRLVTQTHAYWAAIEARKWKEVYSYYTAEYQERHPFITWVAEPPGGWKKLPKLVAIRWSLKAHRHHGPELYAFAEWIGGDAKPTLAGHLVWRQQPDGGFLLENARRGTIARERRI